MLHTLSIESTGQGLVDITAPVQSVVSSSGTREGLCTVFVQHTSASLLIQENADPSARQDLESWLNRLVPGNDELFTHTAEGPDDMPAHIKSALTATSLGVPVIASRLALGIWQGLYRCEHRRRPHSRRVLVHVA